MWQSVATYLAAFFESSFSLHRQRQLTLWILLIIAMLGALLLATIAWADIFYS